MARNKTMTAGNVSITDMEGAGGVAFRIEVATSYGETREERAARIAASGRSRQFVSRKHSSRGGRAGGRRDAIRNGW